MKEWRQALTQFQAPDYEGFDPEEEGLDQRLKNKLEAVDNDRPAPVAELGEPPAPNAPDDPDQPAPAAPAEPETIEM